MRVEIDERSGFCFGVVRAITAAEEALKQGSIVSLGDIVHNPIEMGRLGKLGLRSIDHTSLRNMRCGKVLIRAHGEPPATYEAARDNGVEIVDATCPVVARLQKSVSKAYEEMQAVNGQVVIIGKKGHAEVEGLLGHAEGNAIVVENVDDVRQIDFSRPLYVLSQTTQSPVLFDGIVDEIRSRAHAGITVRNTICREVAGREEHMAEFARSYDVVIFVSGRNSSNGRALFDVCLQANSCSHMIEHEGELNREWFENARSVGVCGATSTPRWLMERVRENIVEIKNN